jgi:hypothetical protein
MANIKKNEIGKTDSGDEFCNVASTAVCWQICVAYVLYIFIYISIFIQALYQ